ncbi:MAG TPA: LamG-like jellyroll fold domain-containing protein [Verrucomicrobiae bacterium]|nr:LamG-like jellyroll fold domain-containing protein [Verrucomicrobiae bacterium]
MRTSTIHQKPWTQIILAQALLLAMNLTAQADLTHRYSFNDAVDSTNAVDSVGGANGALYPGASFPGDGTVALDGTSGFVYLPDDIISNYTSVSFEVWTTPNSNPTWARLFDFGDNQGGPGTGGNGTYFTYICFVDGNNSLRGDILGLTGESIIQGPTPAAGEYHQIVFTVDATAKTGALYDNGVQVAFRTGFNITPQTVGHTFNDYIGRSQYADPYYNGSIDEFRIYNNALSPAQVEADFESGANTTTDSPGALNSVRLNNPTNALLGAVITPSLLANYASLTNPVNISTASGIAYSSANTNVITFGTDGNFHAVSLGTATIQATYQSKTANLTVSVGSEPTVLKHRYSFSGAAGGTTITDSVGGADGTLMNPSATSTLTGSGQLTLDGNASSAYVLFPPGMVSTLTNATFQIWVNFSGGPVWQELYSFGTNFNGAGVAYTTLIPHNGANGNLRWSINEAGETFVDAPSELVISNEVCVTVAYNYTAQSAALYVGGRKVGSAQMSKALFTIPDVDNYLGRSQFSADPYFQGAVDEFRIYSGVKSDLQVAIDATTGPDNLVTNAGNLTSVSLSVATNIDAHGTGVPVQVTANFANVSGVDVTTLPNTSLSSSDPSVATIVNGNVVPQNVGTTIITANYANQSGSSIAVTVVDTNAWPTLAHRWTFNDAPGSTTITDSVGAINGTLSGPYHLTGTQLVMPTPNPVGGGNGLPTASSAWASFPPGEGIVTSLPNEASFEIWVTWGGGPVWQEMFDFGQAATPGVSLGGGNYVMISPHDGASGSLRAEWDQNPSYDVTLTGPALQPGELSQVVWTHDQDRQLDKLYRNGVLVATAANTGLWSTLPDTDNWLARDEWPDAMFAGAYSDFRIWNGSLTAGQVANLYAAGPEVVAGPSLKITRSGNQITLQWPANVTGFSLQTASTLVSPQWTAVTGNISVVNGLNTMTLNIGSSPAFYRLK